jgi:DNA-binding transcriptional LysR family regulator
LHDAPLNGGGISRVLDFSVADHLRRGHLKLLLEDWALGATPINALYPSCKNIPVKARAFVSFVRTVLRDAKVA